MAGARDSLYQKFLYGLLSGEIDFRRASEKGVFEELLNLNLSRFGGKLWSGQLSNSLMVATRYDGKPKLWTCFPLGAVEERSYTSIGSGSDNALKCIEEETSRYLSTEQISIPEGIRIASGALRAAAADPYTKGLDIVVLTEDGIHEFGKEIKDSLRLAEENLLGRIAGQFNVTS